MYVWLWRKHSKELPVSIPLFFCCCQHKAHLFDCEVEPDDLLPFLRYKTNTVCTYLCHEAIWLSNFFYMTSNINDMQILLLLWLTPHWGTGHRLSHHRLLTICLLFPLSVSLSPLLFFTLFLCVLRFPQPIGPWGSTPTAFSTCSIQDTPGPWCKPSASSPIPTSL